MADGLETELKLAASPAMLLHLRGHPLLAGKDKTLTLVTRYFDTTDGALHRAGATLRLREGGGRGEQTFKSTAKGRGSLQRGEWNAPAIGGAPDPAAFPPEAGRQLETLLAGANPQELAVTRVERTARRLRYGVSSIEAAFDFGTVEAGRRSEPICELELELVSGQAADLFALAQELPLGPELGWSVESKGARGHALALELPFAITRASDVALDPEMDVGQGFQAIAWNCLAHLLGNYPEVVVSGNPEALHQSRVAMRRLRAAFSLFAGHVASEEAPVFRAEWKAAASALGPARDLHVLIARVEKAAAETGSDAGELLDRLRSRRAAATREAQTMLAGKAFQHLLVRFAEWLERAGWRAGDGATGPPLTAFAEHTLGRRRRKLTKGKPLDLLSDDALHELRIKGKKLRYAAEFFAALYPQPNRAKARREFAKSLGKLQDCLGSVHDLAVAHDQREALFAELDPITGAGLSAQLGELLDRHGPSRKQLVRSAAKALARIASAPSWWQANESESRTPRATAD